VSGNRQAARPEGDRHMPKDTHSTLAADAELVLPERVTVALAELAGAAREGLLALAVGTGLGVLGSLLDTDVERLVGPRAATTRSGPRSGTAPSLAGSPSAAAGSGSTGLGSAAPTAPPSWLCPPGRRSLGPSCWTSSRWSGCWPSCPPAATTMGWSRSAAEPNRRARGPPGRRCRAGSWPPPSMP